MKLKVLLEKNEYKNLKKNKVPLTDEEREKVIAAGAIWHSGPGGTKTSAVWKSVINGKTRFICRV